MSDSGSESDESLGPLTQPSGAAEEEVAAAEPRAGRPFRICLTGGPCAGKSSALSALRTRLQKLGLQVWAANRHGRACALARPERLRPEGGRCWRCRSARRRSLRARAAMTRPGSAGRSTSSSSASSCAGRCARRPGAPTAVPGAGAADRGHRRGRSRAQIQQEDAFLALASLRAAPAVLLCDRGCLDGFTFCSAAEWGAVLAGAGLAQQELFERYDLVCHLIL